MLIRRIAVGALAIPVVLSIGSCRLSGGNEETWSSLDRVKVMAVDFQEDMSLTDYSDVETLVAQEIVPVQQLGDMYYLSLRGSTLQEAVGEPRDYAIVIWEDVDGDDQIDQGEPFLGDLNDGSGYLLSETSSIVGSVGIDEPAEALDYTIYTVDATYSIAGNATDLFDVDVSATIPGASEVIFRCSQGGWYPDGGAIMMRTVTTDLLDLLGR
jgi:hypothetical protein